MRYIPGTKFINRTRKHTRYFQPGIVYTLKNIKIDPKTLKYIFTTDSKEDKEINFASTEEADGFLDTMC